MSNRYKFCDRCGEKIILGEPCPTCSEKFNRNDYQRKYRKNHKEIQAPIESMRWRKFRKVIIQRDNGVCQRCLSMKGIFNSDKLEVHHIKPREKYPDLIFDEDNCITLCKTCNLELGVKEKLDFERKVEPQDVTFHL